MSTRQKMRLSIDREPSEVEQLTVQLERARKRSKRNARLAEERRVAIVAAMERLGDMERRLRETAEGLRAWFRIQGPGNGVTGNPEVELVHPFRAANRLERMADEINATGRTDNEQGQEKGK